MRLNPHSLPQSVPREYWLFESEFGAQRGRPVEVGPHALLGTDEACLLLVEGDRLGVGGEGREAALELVGVEKFVWQAVVLGALHAARDELALAATDHEP